MTVVAVRIAKQEAGAFSFARLVDEALRSRIHGTHILSVHCGAIQPKRSSASHDIARSSLREVGVLGVQVVLANVDHRQLEKFCEIHTLVQHTLPQRAFAEEAHRYSSIAKTTR